MSDIVPGSKRKKATRKRGKRAPATTEPPVPERAIDPTKQPSRHLQPRTAADITNEETIAQLALRIWAAMVAQKVSIAWFEDEIDDFLEAKAAARDQRKPAEQIHSE